MLDHVEIYVSDLARSRAFWSAFLGRVGYGCRDFGGGFTMERAGAPYLTFVQVEPRHARRPYHRGAVGLNHLAFAARSRAELDAARAGGIKAGVPLHYDARPMPTGRAAPRFFLRIRTGSRWSLSSAEKVVDAARAGA